MGYQEQITTNAAAIQTILDNGVEISGLPLLTTTLNANDVLAMRIASSNETVQVSYGDIIASFNSDSVEELANLAAFPPVGIINKIYIAGDTNLTYKYDGVSAYVEIGGGGGGVPLTTKAEFDAALTDGNFMYIGDTPTAHTHVIADISDFTDNSSTWDALVSFPGFGTLNGDYGYTEPTHAFADLTITPTTLAGYGISDTKVNFNTALSDGTFLFVGDAPTSHNHVIADITDFTDNSTTWDALVTFPGFGTLSGDYGYTEPSHVLTQGATDVTATFTELNLLDLAGLTVGFVLSADSATTASWKAQTGAGGFVPYVGATQELDLGAQLLNGAYLSKQANGYFWSNKYDFSSSGGGLIGIGTDVFTADFINSSIAIGTEALKINEGGTNTVIGHFAMSENIDSSTMVVIGEAAGKFCVNSSDSIYIGVETALHDKGFDNVIVGHQAGSRNTGRYGVINGNSAGFYNSDDYNLILGHEAHSIFDDDTANDKDVANAATDVIFATNRITITAHGFGANGRHYNLKYNTTGTNISGLLNGTIYQFKIIDSNTIESVTNISSTGTDIHTFTPQFIYTNSGAIGANSQITKSNQIVLGDANVTEIVMGNGTVLSGGGASPLTTKGDLFTYDTGDQRLAIGGTDGWALIVDAASATGMKWASVSGGASSLTDLTDVISATNTNRFVLVANGTTGYVGRALLEADISDFGNYSVSGHTHLIANITDFTDNSSTWDALVSFPGFGTLSGDYGYIEPTHEFGDLTVTPTTMSGYGISDTKTNFNIALSNGTFMYVGDAPTAHNHAWADITSGVPTTLSGYGISDTKANFNTALSDGNFMFVGDAPTTHNHNGETIVVGDHGTASVDEVVNVCYGTSATPPSAGTTTEGALYIQYTA